MGAALGEGPQVSLAEEQDALGEFGSGGQDEAFGDAVRSRASGRDVDGVDPGVGEDGVERGELDRRGSGSWWRCRRGPSVGRGPAGWSRLGTGRMAGRAEDVHVVAVDQVSDQFGVMEPTWRFGCNTISTGGGPNGGKRDRASEHRRTKGQGLEAGEQSPPSSYTKWRPGGDRADPYGPALRDQLGVWGRRQWICSRRLSGARTGRWADPGQERRRDEPDIAVARAQAMIR